MIHHVSEILNNLKKIYVFSVMVNLIYLVGTLKMHVPKHLITQETMNLVFWVGCLNLLIMSFRLRKFTLHQYKVTVLVIFRTLAITMMIDLCISSIIRGSTTTTFISFVIAVIHVFMFERTTHNRAIELLCNEYKNK